jgi:hypothetical protein
MDTPLTDTNIRQWLPDCKILEYDWLENFKTIDDLLPNDNDYCVILYERENHIGHWICVMKHSGKIEHFDPLGLKPDKQLTWISKQKRKELNSFVPYLTKIYKRSKQKVIWNKYKYQSDTASTCGRWVVLRLLCFKVGLSLNEFHKWFLKHKKSNETNDEMVLKLI